MARSQAERAEYFRGLHRGESMLVLANVWDAASARLCVQAGFAAVGTTSAGVAMVHGYDDGELVPFDCMLHSIREIANAIDIPASADIESGHGATPEDVYRSVRATIDAGAVGVNVEDTDESRASLFPIEAQLDRLRAVRKAGKDAGVRLVINARTDAYLRPSVKPADRFAVTVERAAAFVEAGADCVFPIGALDADTIGRLVASIDAPVNIIAGPVTLSLAELKDLGVSRVSIGSGLMRACLGHLRHMLNEWKDDAPVAEILGGSVTGRLFSDAK